MLIIYQPDTRSSLFSAPKPDPASPKGFQHGDLMHCTSRLMLLGASLLALPIINLRETSIDHYSQRRIGCHQFSVN
jgi:hypothetical protein